MNRFRFILFAALSTLPLLTLGGCISSMVNRSAGGEMVWWCDVTQARIGSPETHIPGMTKYDPVTGKDVPMEGITQAEVDEALAERRKRREAQDRLPPQVESKKEGSRFGWIPGVGKKEEKKEPAAAPAPEPSTPAPESAPRKSRWKFWQR